MIENNIDKLKEREQEIEATLENLWNLMDSRNNVLTCFEKHVLRKTVLRQFSNLNTGSKGSKLSSMNIIKKNYEIDLKMLRRGQFYLSKRKRFLEAELKSIKESIQKLTSEFTTTS